MTLPPYYNRESHYGPVIQRKALLTLQNSSFQLWEPLDNVPNSTDLIKLTDLPELDGIKDLPINDLIDRLNDLRQPDKLETTTLWGSIWKYLKTTLIFLVVVSIIVLVLWLKLCKGKLSLNCVQAMGNRRISRAETIRRVERREKHRRCR